MPHILHQGKFLFFSAALRLIRVNTPRCMTQVGSECSSRDEAFWTCIVQKEDYMTLTRLTQLKAMIDVPFSTD